MDLSGPGNRAHLRAPYDKVYSRAGIGRLARTGKCDRSRLTWFLVRCYVMTLDIREYRPLDRVSVVALWNEVFSLPNGHNEPASALDRKVAADDGLFFVATWDGELVGTVLAGYDGHRGWLYSLAVRQSHRRQGIGRRLVDHAEGRLKQLGCPKINLQVRGDNTAVLSFYRALGFRTEDRISMGKRLPE